MKEIFEALKKTYWTPLVDNKDSLIEGFCYLILAFQVWCLNIVIPFSVLIIGILIFTLTGKWELHLWEFLRVYYWDGTFMGFTAWRVHLTLYVICSLFTFKYAE